MAQPPVNRPEIVPTGRPYRSTRRAEGARRTRAAIRDAATELFLRDGYARTSMRAIATQAGVSEKTMYLTYETKAALLRHVIQVAVRGDEQDEALSQRSQWQAVFDGPTDGAFARFAALNATIMARTADIIALGEAAAAGDPELATFRDEAHRATRADVHALAQALDRAGALADGISIDAAADTIYALAADEQLYLRLTRECAWTEARYADLLGRMLQTTLGAGG